MRILFFSYAYPNVCDTGLATFNRTMVTGLAKEHAVRVVSPVPFVNVWSDWWKGRLPRGLNDPAFQVVPNVRTEYCPWYYVPKFFRSHYGRFMDFSVRPVLDRTIREFQPEIVLSYWTHPDGEVAVKAAHRHGIRAVTMVGGTDVLLNARRGSRRNSILNVLRAADGVVTVSDAIKRVLMDDGISESKLHVIRRGIDRSVFHRGLRNVARQKLGLPDDQFTMVTVGRLVQVKGHQYLIQACKQLVDRGLKFRCFVLGDGPLRTSLQKQIDQNGLTSVVELKGSQTSAQLADWYRAADLSVLASLSEGVPNVLLESLACGTPFVGSNVGGIPEIADPYLDRLVPAADPNALAQALAQVIANPVAVTLKPRRIEPSTMAQAAANLSSILQYVKTGRMPQPELNACLYQTMTGQGLVDDQLSLMNRNDEPCVNSSCFALAEDDDACGRTAEGFQYRP